MDVCVLISPLQQQQKQYSNNARPTSCCPLLCILYLDWHLYTQTVSHTLFSSISTTTSNLVPIFYSEGLTKSNLRPPTECVVRNIRGLQQLSTIAELVR